MAPPQRHRNRRASLPTPPPVRPKAAEPETSSELELRNEAPPPTKQTVTPIDEEIPERGRGEEHTPPIEGEVKPRTRLEVVTEQPVTEQPTSPIAEEIAKLPSAGDEIEKGVESKEAAAPDLPDLSPQELPEAGALDAAEEQNAEQAALAEEEAADPIAQGEEGRALAAGAYQASSEALELSSGHLMELSATRAEFAEGEGLEAETAAARASDVATLRNLG